MRSSLSSRHGHDSTQGSLPDLESPGESDGSLSPQTPAPRNVLSNQALTAPLGAALELPPGPPGLEASVWS